MRRSKAFLLSLMIILNISSIRCYAFDPNVTDPHDVASWNQGSSIWSENDTTDLNPKVPGKTIHQAGCGLFAITYALVKIGEIDPKTQNHFDVLTKVRNADAWDPAAPNFHVDGRKIDKFTDDLKIATIDGVTMWDYPLSTLSKEDAYTYVKKLYNQGYFIQLCMGRKSGGAHYVFVDSFEDDDMIIGDSGYRTTRFKEFYYNDSNQYFYYINVYESKSGKKCNKLPSIYDGSATASSRKGYSTEKNEAPLSEEEKELQLEISSEWQLRGMSELEGTLKDNAFDIDYSNDLTEKQQEAVDLIKTAMDDDKSDVFDKIRVLIKTLGLILMIYSILLVVCYVFDRANTLLDISLVRIVTFGKYKVYMGEDITGGVVLSKLSRTRFLTVPGLLKRSFIIFGAGLLIISGGIYNLAQLIINWLGKI